MGFRVTMATLFALSAPVALAAQVCFGKPSLTYAAVNVGGVTDFIDGARRYGGEVVLGSRAFLSGTFSYSDFENTDRSLKVLGATLAYEVPSDDAHMCIGTTGTYGFGPDSSGLDGTVLGIGPVLAVGVETDMAGTVTMIQHGRFGWVWEKVSVDDAPPGEEERTRDYGLLLLGVSLVFNRVLAIGPSVTFPLGIESGKRVFTVGVTIGFPTAN